VAIGISFGTSNVFGDVDNQLGATITATGNSNVTFWDDLNNDGTVQVSTGSTAVYFGTVSSSGSFPGGGTNFFEADLAPGASPGIVIFGGDVVFGALARLESELQGTIPGSEHDLLKITGTISLDGALDLVTGPDARRAFELHREPESLRDRYGRNPCGQNLLMARRLVEAGVRLVTVNAWCGVAEGDHFHNAQAWDHHGATSQKCGIFDTGTFSLRHCLPRFDQSLAALIEDLDARGMLDTTLVVAVGEFGRSPTITYNPFSGREHWSQCYSGLLAGGEIRGGLVYGRSDQQAAYVADLPVSPEDFAATI